MSNPNGIFGRLRSTLFGDSGRAFGTMSVVLLVLLAIAPRRITSASGVIIKSST